MSAGLDPSSSISSFENLQVEDASPDSMEEVQLGEASPPNPGATHPSEQQQASQAPADQGAGEAQNAGGQLPQQAGGQRATTAGAAEQSSPPAPPPATQALASVFSFFGSGSSSGDSTQADAAPVSKAAAADAAAEPEAELEDAVRTFEAEALEAADKVAQAAEEVGQKLLHGAAEAKESLSSLAQGITSWWSTLDPVQPSTAAASSLRDAKSGGGSAGGGAAADAGAAAEQLGLAAGETVLESFACQLWQSYTATNNFFTPVRQIPFPGSLHVTSQRLCFVFDDRVAPIKLAGKAIKGVAKQPADPRQGLPQRLELSLESKGQSLVLADFALGALELDSALALVEHLSMEGQ